jgi:phosphate transport system permease protein
VGLIPLSVVALAILALTLLGYWLGRSRALAMQQDPRTGRLRALPQHHGYFVALCCGLPAVAVVLAWLLAQQKIVDWLLLAGLPERLTEHAGAAELDLLVTTIKNVAGGILFGEPDPAVLAAAARYQQLQGVARAALLAVVLAVAIAGLAWARGRLAPHFPARNAVERILGWLLVLCSIVAILTTLGILLSLLVESWRFFRRVPPQEFLLGLNWEPQIPIREDQVAGLGAFGAVPVFVGTIVVSAVAMTVALPVGLLSAIYMAEYATPRVRLAVKPLLEILAGVPTIVYGFFAVLVVSPALRTLGAAIGLEVAPTAAIVPGAVMGIMLIPFISSLSDDAITAVPQAMRDGAAALGATKAEIIRQVLLPAALPGIMGGVLLAVSRAIGETMIVVMAAGLTANLTLNPLQGVTTTTVQIVTLLIGDTEFDSPKTLAAFGLGLVLFLSTLLLNIAALRIVKRYREKYD